MENLNNIFDNKKVKKISRTYSLKVETIDILDKLSKQKKLTKSEIIDSCVYAVNNQLIKKGE